MDKGGFREHLSLRVFMHRAPDTMRISIVESSEPPLRMMVDRGVVDLGDWKYRLHFYAYERERPGTQRIWVAYRGDPDRCMFLKGGPDDMLEGWEQKLEFWVPFTG